MTCKFEDGYFIMDVFTKRGLDRASKSGKFVKENKSMTQTYDDKSLVSLR